MDENQNNEQPEVITNVEAPKVEKKGFNITSMILGIIGLVFFWLWYINIPCSIVAIIFSIAGKKEAGRGMGVAGMVLAIIALVVYVLLLLAAMFLAASIITSIS